MVAGQITITYEASDEPLVVNVPANVGVTAGQALDIVRSELGLSGTLRDQAGALCPPGYQLQAGSAYRFTAARAPPPVLTVGRTAYEALNSSLPAGTTALLKPSSSSRPSHLCSPGAVLPWKEAQLGNATSSLNEAILAYQGAADNQDSGLTRPPATLATPMDSEAEVCGHLQAWVMETLTRLASQLPYGKQATWRQIPPSELLQEATILSSTHEVEREPAAAASTRSGRMSRSPSAGSSELQGSSSTRSRLKEDFVLTVEEQPSQPGQPPAKRRRVCVGEVKQPSVLLSSVEDLPDLVAAYTQQDNERHRQAVAVIRQVYTYLQVGRLCHGYITCWFGTWLVYCPSQQRDTLYVSQAYGASTSASSTQSAVTAMGALAWLQDQALQVDPSQVTQYKAPAPGQAGGGEADPDYNSGEDAGALDGSQDEWHPDIDSSRPRSSSKGSGPSSSSKSGSSSRGRGLSSGRPQQQGGRVTLLLQDKLQEGSAGAVVLGAYGGMPAVVKLLGPDGPGLRAYETEAAMYSMLACVQGVVVPRLLGTGSLPGGVMFLATSRVDGTPLSSFRTVPTAVADAALRALATLHRKFAGFLHNDIRLANILLLSNPAMSDVSPKCMLLDFGRSRADGTKAEQQREYMALKKLLGA